MIKELIGNELQKSSLFIDNQSTIKLIKNPQFHCRTKHIDIKYNFIREKYSLGLFKLEYVNSKNQQADLLTKGLPKEAFERLRKVIGVWKCDF